MDALEKISEQKKCWFVDLFVRVSNSVAITMYRVSVISAAYQRTEKTWTIGTYAALVEYMTI